MYRLTSEQNSYWFEPFSNNSKPLYTYLETYPFTLPKHGSHTLTCPIVRTKLSVTIVLLLFANNISNWMQMPRSNTLVWTVYHWIQPNVDLTTCILRRLSGCGNALDSHRCDPGWIHGVGMSDSHVVTKSDRWVSSGHSGFLPHEDHRNAIIGANEHD